MPVATKSELRHVSRPAPRQTSLGPLASTMARCLVDSVANPSKIRTIFLYTALLSMSLGTSHVFGLLISNTEHVLSDSALPTSGSISSHIARVLTRLFGTIRAGLCTRRVIEWVFKSLFYLQRHPATHSPASHNVPSPVSHFPVILTAFDWWRAFGDLPFVCHLSLPLRHLEA